MTTLPRLAYVFHPVSFPAMLVREAARGLCDLIWVIDSSEPGSELVARLLRRSGTVVDVRGMSTDAAAEAIRAEQPDGFLSIYDGHFRWAAEVAERLGLPFHSPEAALLLTDKHLQRRALRDAGLRVPGFWVIGADADPAGLPELLADATFPAVLKPRQGQSSRDTLPVASFAELTDILARLRGRDQPREEYVLEEFVTDALEPLGGAEFANYLSVESIVCDGRIAHAGVTGRTPLAYPFRETGFFTPAALDAALRDEVLAVATAAVGAVEVRRGVLHTEIKLTADGPVVIEVNGRPGGGMTEILEKASGFSLLHTALRLAIGEDVRVDGPVDCDGVGYLLYVHAPAEYRRVGSIEGLGELAKVDGVDEIELIRGPGHAVDWREGNQAHVFRVWGAARDHGHLRSIVRFATRDVRIEPQLD